MATHSSILAWRIPRIAWRAILFVTSVTWEAHMCVCRHTQIPTYLNVLVVFPSFFNLSLSLAIRSSWSSHCQLPVLFLLTVWSFFIFGCKECNQSYFGIDHLMMSMCRVFSWVVGRGCLLWLVHSLGKTLLAFALLHSVFQGQICLLLQLFLDFLLLHSSPYNEKDIFLGC